MKYFTRKWWNFTCTEAGDDTFERYNAYVDSIRDKLTCGLIELVDRADLHDGRVQKFTVTGRISRAKLILNGYDPTVPWKGQPPPAKITLTYLGVTHINIKGRENPCRAWFNRSDLGYDEIKWLKNGLFEHRMLFDTGTELIIRFRDVQVVKALTPSNKSRRS